jgi:MYXO-CTERM domain-containing protein
VLFLLSSRPALATQVDPTNFAESLWTTVPGGNLTSMAWAPDASNRLFVTVKDGPVRIIKYGSPPALVATPFATMNPVYTNSECGVLGIVFDPNFQVNQYVYFFVTVSSSEQQIIRYTAQGDVGTNRTVIVSGLPTAGQNHDGGSLGIGPDRKLYWGIGDNGNGTGVNADLSSMASKIGRANVDGSVPNDNPFFDGTGPNADYIWARGVRNPFTLTFQPTTGALWVDVVGTSYEQTFIINKGDHAGYNAYENNQPAPNFIAPVIKYKTNGTDSQTITGAARSGNVATFTTTGAHGFRRGELITIAGVTDASFNGNAYVSSILNATTFTGAQTGPDATSGGGTATTQALGGCMNGGTFYDGTQFGTGYRGNYFFGDFNSGNMMRAVLSSPTTIQSVDVWATGIDNYIDVDTGPDGALYYVAIGGNVYRTEFNTAAQALVVSRTHVWMSEGGQYSVGVRLAAAPSGAVTVRAARSSGDTDVRVGAGATLTFNPANWSVPQPLTITDTADADTLPDTATIGVSSFGLTTVPITVNVIEDTGNVFVLSKAALGLTEGGSGTLTVALSAAPAGTVTVNVARTAGDSDVTVSGGATLTFNAGNFSTPQTVIVSAAEDADTASDSATISVTATGFTTRTVAVTATDNDPLAPTITSTPVTQAVVNSAYSYTVTATGLPAPTFSLTAPPSGMTIDKSTGAVTWTPASTGSFQVTVVASNGVAPNASQVFTIAVAVDAPPTCVLTKPTEGEVVSGVSAEFFGDGFDDVGTTKAEFFVDDILGYVDIGTQGHYHFQGGHNLWDTTRYIDGVHTAKIRITDTSNQTCEKEVHVTVSNHGDPGPTADASVGEDAGTPDAGAKTDGGGMDGTGGAIATGGATGSGGTEGSGGAGGADESGGTSGSAETGGHPGKDAGAEPTSTSDSGCSCRTASAPRSPLGGAAVLLGVFLAAARRHRRRSTR